MPRISLLSLRDPAPAAAAVAPEQNRGVALGPFEDPEEEEKFQQWYRDIVAAKAAKGQRLNPDPDDPRHFYDHRRQFLAGPEFWPDADPSGEGHGSSQFKLPGHPNRIVDGEDTITGLPADERLERENVLARAATIGPRAFRNEPPKSGRTSLLTLSPDYVPEEELEPTVSQMRGVIPQEDVNVDAAHEMPGGITGLAHRFIGRPLSRFGLRGAQAAGTLLETNVADVLPEPFSTASRIAGTTMRALGDQDTDITVGGTGLPGDREVTQTGEFRSELLGSQEEGFAPRLIESVVENLPQFATNIGMRAVSGPAGGILYSYVAEKGGAYEQFLDQGYSKDEADAMSTWSGGINALTEQIMPGATGAFRGLKPFTRGIARMLVGAGLEGTTEGFQGITPDIVAALGNGNWQPLYDRFGQDQIDELLLEVAAGAIMGGPTAPYIGAKEDVARDLEDAAEATHGEAVQAWEQKLAEARSRIEGDRRLAAGGADLEEGAELLSERDSAALAVAVEERQRELDRAAFEEQQGARGALEKEAQFPFAPGAVQPTEDRAPEDLLAAESRLERERAGAARQAEAEKMFPTMPTAMRERMAPPPLEPPPAARTSDEFAAEVERRATAAPPSAPSPAVGEAQAAVEWRDRLQGTFKLSDDQIADSEVWMQAHGVTRADVVPGGELESQMVDELFKRESSLPANYKIRRDKQGRIVGARHITKPSMLRELRKQWAIMAKTGRINQNWYEKSSSAILDYVGGNVGDAEVFAKMLAITSANTNVATNWKFATRAFQRYKAGLPLTTSPDKLGRYPNAMARRMEAAIASKDSSWAAEMTAEDLAADMTPEEIAASAAEGVAEGEPVVAKMPGWSGRKIKNFYNNLMVNIDPARTQGVTVDVWMGRAFGYVDKPVVDPVTGKAPKAKDFTPTDAQYDFIETEVMRTAEKLGIKPHQAQAAIWIAAKSGWEGTTPDQAGFDFSNALTDHLAQVSWESEPGKSAASHMPELRTADWGDKMEYRAAIMRALVDDDGNDRVAMALGIRSPASFPGLGVWKLRVTPGAQSEIPVSVVGEGLSPKSKDDIELYAAVMGIILKQDGMGYNAPVHSGDPKQKNALDVKVSRKTRKQKGFTKDQVEAINQKLGDDVVVVATRNGLRLINQPWATFTGEENNDWRKSAMAVLDEVADTDPDIKKFYGEPYKSDGSLIENDWEKHPNGEGYLEGLAARRPDLQGRAESVLSALLPHIEDVERGFVDSKGNRWTPNQRLNAKWRQPAGRAAAAPAAPVAKPGAAVGPGEPGEPETRGPPAEEVDDTGTLFQEGPPLEFPKRGSAKRPLQSVGPEDLQQILRRAEAPRASALRKEIADIERTPGWRFDDDLRSAHEDAKETLEELEQRPEAAAEREVRAGNKAGLEAKTAKARARLAAIEATPSWRFDPALREEHARLTKGSKLTQEMLDRGLYQGKRGVAQFPAAGPAVIKGLQNPDVSTAIHELTHVARRRLGQQDQGRLERIYGVKGGQWTRAQEERFAEDAERYYRGLKDPPKLARPMFDRVRDGLQKLYTRFTQGDEAVADINPEVRRFFDEKIIGEKPAAKPAAETTGATEAAKPGAAVGAVAQMLPEEITDLVEPGAVKRVFKKWFTKESLNPDSAYALHETARSEMRGHVVDASQAAVDWYRVEKQDKKSRNRKADREALGRYLRGEQAALADISTEAGRAAATRMRGAINNMQNALLASGMLEPGSAMRTKVEDSIGTYITRQYKAFREPSNWNYKSVEKNHKHLLNNAVKWVQGQLAAENDGVAPSEEDVKLRIKELFPDEADGNNPFALLDKVGKKDLGVFMQKKDVPEVLRKLLGEYEDPVVNFMQTYQHVAQVVVNHKMLSELKTAGLKEGWLSEKKTLEMDKEFTPAGTAYSPLAGMYGSQDAVDAWNRLTRPKEITSGLGRVTLRAMGGLRAVKTVFNPTTHFGNVIGNYPIMLANGNWGAFGAKNGMAWKVAWNAAFDDISKSDDKVRALASKLTRLGVIQQSIGASDLRDLIQETGGMGDVFLDPSRANANKVIGLFGRVAKIYGAEDDGPKALSYLMEYAKYKQVFPNMPEEQLEQRVADIVKDTMPTWSRINPELRRLRRRLPFGNFASFSMEIVRTRVATQRLANKEIKAGKEMRARGKEIGNHELEAEGRRLERMGYRRAVSNVTVPLMFGGLAELSKALLGIDEEEEDKMQRGFPMWERWTPKLYTSRPAGGRATYISLSGIDPFGALKRPITAARELALEDPVQAMRSGFAELIRPYADTDFLTRFIMENALGFKVEDFGLPERVEGKLPRVGKTLFKENDPENWARFTRRVLDEFSLYKTGKRVERAWEERISESGQAGTIGMEFLGMTTRLRPATLDWNQALLFRRKFYDEDLDDAKYFFTGPANRFGEPDLKVVRTGLHSFVQQSIERQREMFLDIDAARSAGMTDDQIIDSLTSKELGPYALSKKLVERVMAGTIVIEVPATKHGEAIQDELDSTADDIVKSYQKRYLEDGLTIELE